MTDRLRPSDPNFSARRNAVEHAKSRALMEALSAMYTALGTNRLSHLPYPGTMLDLAGAVENVRNNGLPGDDKEAGRLRFAQELYEMFGEAMGLTVQRAGKSTVFSDGRSSSDVVHPNGHAQTRVAR